MRLGEQAHYAYDKRQSLRSGEDVGILEQGSRLVLARQLRRDIAQLPVDVQLRVIPQQAALGRRIVVVSRFIKEFRIVAQHHETMGKALRNPELAVVFGGKSHGNPFAEVWRTTTDVDRHIEHFTGTDAHQFALGVLQLIMQATQHALLRARVIVLYELGFHSGQFLECLGVEALIEKAAFITKYLRFDDQDIRQVGGDYLHGVFLRQLEYEIGAYSCPKWRTARVFSNRGGLLILPLNGVIGVQ